MADTWMTLGERKAKAAARITHGVAGLRKDLEAYAKAEGGRFILYGSAARGDHRFNSDVDLIVDFPLDKESGAWRYAEEACRRHGLVPDVRPLRFCESTFLSRIAKEMEHIS